MPCVYLPGPAPAVTVANNYVALHDKIQENCVVLQEIYNAY